MSVSRMCKTCESYEPSHQEAMSVTVQDFGAGKAFGEFNKIGYPHMSSLVKHVVNTKVLNL